MKWNSGRSLKPWETAYALSDEREKARHAGCVDYLSKPIRKEAILLLMEKYLN